MPSRQSLCCFHTLVHLFSSADNPWVMPNVFSDIDIGEELLLFFLLPAAGKSLTHILRAPRFLFNLETPRSIKGKYPFSSDVIGLWKKGKGALLAPAWSTSAVVVFVT